MSETPISLDEFKSLEGESLEPSDWIHITQDQINLFADATGDKQYIHVDPQRMKNEPLGTTIAHGFFCLSLMVGHPPPNWPSLEGTTMLLNYGLDRLRFMNPVKVDSSIRFHTKILSVTEKPDNKVLVKSERTLEIRGEEKPGFVAEFLIMILR